MVKKQKNNLFSFLKSLKSKDGKKNLIGFALLLIGFSGGFLAAFFIVGKFPQIKNIQPERMKELPLTEKEVKNGKQPEIDLVVGKEIPLPEGGEIGGYIQSQLIDLDGDKTKEAIAIYHDVGEDNGEWRLYKPFFVIFKLRDNKWVKLTERELESFSIWNERESLVELGKLKNQFELADL